MARTGKIARLPLAIRDELNTRLRDNESGQTILEWVNGLEVTRELMKRSFGGEPISDANLSFWRQPGGGYEEWLHDELKVHKLEKLSELSYRLAKASGGNMSAGVLAIAVGKLHEALEAGCDVEVDEETGKETMSGVPVDKLAAAIAKIRGMELEERKLENEDKKLALKEVEVALKGEALTLENRKFNHLLVKSFIEWMADERAKELANSDMPSDAKLEALGKHLFGEAW